MTIVTPTELIVSHLEICEFGQERFRETLAAGEIKRIPITVGHNKIRFIYRMFFGDITANVFNFRFDNTRNAIEKNILLGTEQTNFDTRFFPFLIVKEGRGIMVVQNTDTEERDFECTIHYLETIKEFVERMQKATGWKDIV